MTPGDFQAIQAQPDVDYWNGVPGSKSPLYSDQSKNYEIFVDKVVDPALSPGSAPLGIVSSGRQGELFVDRVLSNPVGVDRAGVPTNVVRIVIRYDWGLSLGSLFSGGSGSIWQATGAYPIPATQKGRR